MKTTALIACINATAGVSIEFTYTKCSDRTLNNSLKTGVKMSQPSRLDEAQGANEKRTELYLTYSDGVSEFATKRFAKSASGVAGMASRQAGTARGSR